MPYITIKNEGLEDVLESKVHKWLSNNLPLHFKHIWYVKVPAGVYGKKSAPDFIFCINGLFISIEVKRCSGKLTVMQNKTAEDISEAKGLSIVLYGKDPEVFDVINKYINNHGA